MSIADTSPSRDPAHAANDTVLLVGNPNAGKTSLFNALSGLRARTANYPGITVDLRKVTISLSENTAAVDLIDLPGLYSLTPSSPEETVAVDALQGQRLGRPAAIVLVLDSTNMARNLPLAGEVLELGLPTLVLLNMIDAANSSGVNIDIEKLKLQLECPVVAVSAKTGVGLDDAKRELSGILKPDPSALPMVMDRPSCAVGCDGCKFSARYDWSEAIAARTVSGAYVRSPMTERIDRILTAPWVGTVMLLLIMLSVFFTIFSLADVPMSLIEGAFTWLADLVSGFLPQAPVNSLLWMPIVAGLTIATCAIGYRLRRIKWSPKSIAFAGIASALVAALPQADFGSLLVNGVIGGIAGVVVFLPQICILFFFITLLEDTGYMARAAFVMERVMRFVGLPGKAFVPMLSAHACAIPGIMATRTIDNWRDRLVTILVLPLLTCSARLPVYAMVATLLFGDQPLMAGVMFAAAYLLGLFAALATAWCLKKTVLTGEAAPLVIELPPYRMPTLRNALMTTLDRAVVFIRKAGSVILLISVVLWAMATYPKIPESEIVKPATGEVTENSVAMQALEYSYAGRAGKAMQPVFEPLGFDWKLNVAVVTSFAAREVLVSTLSVVYGLGEEGAEDEQGLTAMLRSQERPDGSAVFNPATCISLLVFYVLAMQCLPTQAVTRRETGSWGWAIFQFAYMSLLAYVAAWAAYRICIAAGIT